MFTPWELEKYTRSTVPPLKVLTVEALAGRLGELATAGNYSTYCCGGDLVLPQAIDLVYQQIPTALQLGESKEGQSTFQAGRITLPGASVDSLSELVSASTPSGETVGTYQLDNGSFFTSFQLCSTTILNEIEAVLQPGGIVRAEIDKLNIHAVGSYLKRACRGSDKGGFGKLVVCLPALFAGGPLIMHHCGNKMEYQWSNSTVKSPIIHWAAFFSSTEHELLQVTSGHCITLTYNLYSAGQRLTSLPSGNPFCQLLHQVMIHPHFLRHGGSLGFQCQHSYQCAKLNQEECLSTFLKGADYVVYSAAKVMGLSVVVRPLVQGYKHWYLMAEFAHECGYYDAGLSAEDADLCALEQPINVEMEALGACVWDEGTGIRPKRRPHPVTWCTALKPHQIAGYYPTLNGSVQRLHQAPVIIVDIPNWSEQGCRGAATRGKDKRRQSDAPNEELEKEEKEVYFWLQDWCQEGEETEFEWLIEWSNY